MARNIRVGLFFWSTFINIVFWGKINFVLQTILSSSEDWDFYWCDVGYMKELFDQGYFEEHMRINHFRNHYEVLIIRNEPLFNKRQF